MKKETEKKIENIDVNQKEKTIKNKQCKSNRNNVFLKSYKNCLLSQFKKYLSSRNKKNIAVVNLHGVINAKTGQTSSDGLNYANVKELLNKVLKIKNLAAIVISINSPGGSPVQSELIAKKIQRTRKDYVNKFLNNKIDKNLSEIDYKKYLPIYAVVEDVAASGGYWLACSADEIYASNSSIIGSIGVVFQGFGFDKAINKIGIERRVFTKGKNKSILDPFLPTNPEDINLIKKVQLDIFNEFKKHVIKNRDKITEADKDLFTGRFWSGKQALHNKLIDGILDLEELLDKKIGIDTYKVKVLNTKKKLFRIPFFSLNSNIIDTVLMKIEEKLAFSRLGL